jgi:hypothetical protein
MDEMVFLEMFALMYSLLICSQGHVTSMRNVRSASNNWAAVRSRR